jgi:hypothetical protein
MQVMFQNSKILLFLSNSLLIVRYHKHMMVIHKLASTGHFCYVTGSTAEALLCCSSRSDSDMLRVWSSFNLTCVECGIKMVAVPEVSTRDEQH